MHASTARTFCLALAASLLTATGTHADWQQFRGSDGTSVTSAALPTEFGGADNKHIAWKTELPGRAVNGPIVVGNQVITTTSSGQGQKRLQVYSLDDTTGAIQWRRRFWATGRTLCHPLSAMAAPTPACDGQRIYAMFASNDLICLDMSGDVLWMRALSLEFPNAFDDRGLASSPWVAGDTVIVQIACSGDSFACGLEASTGQTKWKMPLAKTTNWTTPCQVSLRGEALVVLQSAERLLVIEPETGSIRHTYEAEGNLIPSPAVAGEIILMPADGLTALSFAAGEEEPELLWQEAKVGAESASPVVAGERFFVMRRPNVLTSARVEDGSVLWKKRLSGNGFWATPLVSDQHVYVANTDGLVQVVRIDDGELVGENEMGEEILGSPAAAGEALYLRSTSSVIKVKGI